MKKIILPLLFLALAAVLAYTYKGSSLLLGMLMVLSFLFLLVIGLVKLFRGRMHKNWYLIPMLTIAICFLGMLVSFFRPYDPAVIDSGDVSQDLEYAYQTDQGDRQTLRSYFGSFKEELQRRDSLRLDLVQRLHKQEKIIEPLDKFHAAFVYHHSGSSEMYERANYLATEAAAAEELKDHYQAQWLAKATYDRWKISLGKPGKYGTQDRLSTELKVDE